MKVIYVADDIDAQLEVAYIDHDDLLRNMVAYGKSVLDPSGRMLEAAGVRYSLGLLDKPAANGRIAETILAEAVQSNADLIVLGAHGRRGFMRAVMGGVAQQIVRQSNKPVLLIRGGPESE
ncbi:universal stress protein [Cupriavidus sp. UYPR2.512]|uniref:universal stress protein n=1 Tax=Cupriavidus sp. UYPR2.512 TaxID=1080187 RepID=UPI0003A4B2D7|nr:universal stress protein [Cupriavidus sp. UYPR2.512]